MRDPVSALDPRPPITVPLGATLGDAVRQMIGGRTGAVLVTDAGGALAGILTERDFLTKVAGAAGFERLPVAAFMTRGRRRWRRPTRWRSRWGRWTPAGTGTCRWSTAAARSG
jgi:CBS domain-containing protein